MHLRTARTLGLALVVLLTAGRGVRAGVIIALDPGVGPGSATPVEDLALKTFQGEVAAASETLVNFEGASATSTPTGNGTWAALNATGTVMVETTNTDHAPPPGYQYGVTNSSNSLGAVNNAKLGFSTDGTQHFEFVPLLNLGPNGSASVTFRSSTPFQAFAFNLTGLGDAPGTLTLSFQDGGTTYHQVINGSTLGGSELVQDVGDGGTISQFTLTMSGFQAGTRDVFGIDDIRLAALSVPEPSGLLLAGSALAAGGVGFVARRRPNRSRHD